MFAVCSAPNPSLERSVNDKVLTSWPCAARAQLVRYTARTVYRSGEAVARILPGSDALTATH
jgi:hypothetical protein